MTNLCLLQISANNSTMLRYLKITRYLAINRVRIVGRFGYIIRISIHVWTMIFVRVQTGLVIVIDWTRSWVFNIELRLDREHRLLRFALRTNLESVPCYAEIWSSVFTHSSLFKQSDQWGNKFNQEKTLCYRFVCLTPIIYRRSINENSAISKIWDSVYP